MTPRAQDILFRIVRSYIETGEPQGSRTIAGQLDRAGSSLAGSPATIRNVMAELTGEGFLAQPHTSAGRIPTESAFRAYVQWLIDRPLPARFTGSEMFCELGGIGSFEERVERSCRFLTEVSGAVGIAAAIEAGDRQLEHIELIGLSDNRVLVVVVTRGGTPTNRVVSLDEQLSAEDIASLRNYINWNFRGWQLSDARAEIQRRIAHERAACDALLRQLATLAERDFLQSDKPPHIHMEGASNLVGLDLHLTRERMRDLFRTLEEKQRVADLLDRYLETGSGLGVQIGFSEAHPFMQELALVGVTVQLPGGATTRLAVLGPMRMNYWRVISAVRDLGRTFERVQNS